MKNKIAGLLAEIQAFEAQSKEHIEEFRLRYLSKKGIIPSIFNDFKEVLPEDRKEIAILLNEL